MTRSLRAIALGAVWGILVSLLAAATVCADRLAFGDAAGGVTTPPSGIADLAKFPPSPENDEFRRRTIRARSRSLYRGSNHALIKEIESGLVSDDVSLLPVWKGLRTSWEEGDSAKVVGWIGRISDSAATSELLRIMARDPGIPSAEAALEQLIRRGGKGEVLARLEALEKEGREGKIRAARLLGRLGGEEKGRQLLEILAGDGDPGVAWEALQSLSKADPRRGQPILAAFLRRHPRLVVHAPERLPADDVAPLLREIAVDSRLQGGLRAEALQALRRVKKLAKKDVKGLVRDADPDVRLAATALLERGFGEKGEMPPWKMVLDTGPSSGFGLDGGLPLRVRERAGIGRVMEPVTSGIPLPEGAVRHGAELVLNGPDGSPVEAQFVPLARWPDGSLRWVLTDFAASVGPWETAVFTLRKGKARPVEGIRVAEGKESFTVTTRKLKVVIRKEGFNLFDGVWRLSGGNPEKLLDGTGGGVGATARAMVTDRRNNRTLKGNYDHARKVIPDDLTITPTRKCGDETWRIEFVSPTTFAIIGSKTGFDGYGDRGDAVTVSRSGALVFSPPAYADMGKDYSLNEGDSISLVTKGYGGAFSSSLGRVTEARVERAGPLHTVLTIRGELAGSSGRALAKGATYTVRLHFYRDAEVIRAFVRLEANEADLPLAGFHVGMKSAGLAGGSVEFDGYRGDLVAETTVEQLSSDFSSVYRDGKGAGGSYRADNGTLRLRGGDRYLQVGVRHYWENYPKRYRVGPEGVRIELLAEGQPSPNSSNWQLIGGQWFPNGRHKTHEILFRFAPSDDRVDSAPLFALAPSAWYGATKAFGEFGAATLTGPTDDLAEAAVRWERFNLSRAYPECGDAEATPLPLVPGWATYGDLPWGGGWASLHYDWPYVMLLHYLRTGAPRLLDLGIVMGRMRIDILQNHGPRDPRDMSYVGKGFQWYEKSNEIDEGHDSWVGKGTHTWIGGALLYYLLTGNEAGLETAREVGAAYISHVHEFLAKPVSMGEIRLQGWGALALLQLYWVTGEKQYLDHARAYVMNSLVWMEEQNGKRGFWDNDDKGVPNQAMTMVNYVQETLVNFHRLEPDERLKGALLRNLDWLMTEAVNGGVESGGKYIPLGKPYHWRKDKPGARSNSIYELTWYVDSFAYAYTITGDRKYLEFARRLFRDALFWHDVFGVLDDKPYGVDPRKRSAIQFHSSLFAQSATKVGADMGRSCAFYLELERRLAEQGKK